MNTMCKLLTLSIASLLVSVTAATATDFIGRGNEPFWVVRKTDHDITFQPMEGTTATISPVPAVEDVGGVEVYQATFQDQSFRLAIANQLCVDTMSGMTYPASVEVDILGKTLSGCGGEPASLLHGEWAAEQINGKVIVSGSTVTLNFEIDGRLNGSAGCNRYLGAFVLTGEGLGISKLGSSMMMCEQPLMDQERLFLDVLGATTHFEIGPSGTLILLTNDGGSVMARKD